jgi:hypothetical protein
MDPTHKVPYLIPVLQLSYNDIISEAKTRILKAIESARGLVDN